MSTSHEIEIEVKVLAIDSTRLEATLRDLGAKKRYNTTMRIISYDFIDAKKHSIDIPQELREVIATAQKYFAQNGSLKENNAHLRLRYRSDSDGVEFGFKVNADDIDMGKDHKVAHEYNTYLSTEQANNLEENATTYGLKQIAVHEKKRQSYILHQNQCICDIDTYPGIPTYVEVEGSNMDIINDTISLLGLANGQLSHDSGKSFFKSYGVEYYSTLEFKE